MTALARPSLLLADDDQVFRDRLARALGERGLDVTTAADCDAALDLARRDPPELAVVDLKMPGRSGLDLVRELLALDPQTVIVVLTGYGSIPTAVEAMKAGARHYLTKPADADQILAALGAASAGAPAVRPVGLDAAISEGKVVTTPSLARVEWEYIQRVLADCAGNVSEAARRLGLHRRSLQRKLWKTPPEI